ncbi:flagellar hook-basal body complex protein FliE [Pseudodesulfovibrio sp.]|uniref:flagellar hook-basal body complex protein FliE n=1 Tax=Pseudodesulfovibrio sp. TaxID=2035812 RepID=UPI00261BB243|nr:flagellar hook-basal body complex protein FliE [Pseudodesulfovibrio sp.]MDD3312370.1 flagellar hook-basal body complex protein FliE [Pseudodesulfovibrio sp.]
MVVKSVAISAYQNAMELRRRSVDNTVSERLRKPQAPAQGFGETLKDSLKSVNDMQEDKNRMIEEFASGKSQNVHELMISLQKAGLAVSMTSAVRSKLMTAYQELMKMPF